MAQVARYQPQRLFAEHDVVKTFHGLDPLTGLPVLIYRFAGRPSVKVGELKSEAIPTILTSSFERGNAGRGQLVVAYAKGYEPLTESVQPHEVMSLLRDSATALFDAARASIVHGDLRPERFLKANDHVMLEGYGVPWATWDAASEFSSPERIGGASAKSDVFSWARSVRFLAGRHLPSTFAALLEACLDADPKNRPSAETIYKEILGSGDPTEETPDPSPFDDLDFASSEEETFSKNPFVPTSQRGTSQEGQREVISAPSTGDARTNKATRRDRSGTSRVSTYGATYASTGAENKLNKPVDAPLDLPFDFSGERNKRPRRKARGRRIFLLTTLLIGLLVLGALALFNRGTLDVAESTAFVTELGSRVNTGISTGISTGVDTVLGALANLTGSTESAQSGSYLINIEVVPANVQAELFVVESPEGSSLPAQRSISVVPGSAVLDRTGVWRLQARVSGPNNVRSEVQEVRIPDERSVTFTLPPPSEQGEGVAPLQPPP